MFEWSSWDGTLIAVAIALLANLAVAVVIKLTIAVIKKKNQWLRTLLERQHLRLQVLVALVAVWVVGGLTAPALYEWWAVVSHLFMVAVVIAGAWLISGLSSFGFDLLAGTYARKGESYPEVRRMRTQLLLLRRLATVLIGVIAIGIVLFSFPEVRAVGTSVLASAGIISVIAGLAAQTTLGNVIVGIQLAFSNAIRVGDVVVVEDEWGTIGEITLTYVVVYVWDERRLILPCTYFANQPFENWTRKSDRILGTVFLDLDWRVPIQSVREKFDEILASTDLWDGRSSNLRVTDAQGGNVTVRLVVSAKDSDDQWLLRCLVREELITWLQTKHPEALPSSRVIMTGRE